MSMTDCLNPAFHNAGAFRIVGPPQDFVDCHSAKEIILQEQAFRQCVKQISLKSAPPCRPATVTLWEGREEQETRKAINLSGPN